MLHIISIQVILNTKHLAVVNNI